MQQTIVKSLLGACGALVAAGSLGAAKVNVYPARHYEGDAALYDAFTKETGIKVNRKEGKPEELLQLIVAQGNASPADVLVTVDAGNLWRAEAAGVVQPVASPILSARIPAQFRDPSNNWFGIAYRVRLIAVALDQADKLNVKSYDDLAAPRFKGMVCARQSSNIYNLSLLGARIGADGAAKAQAWAAAVAGNFARQPQGGDTDQLLAVASGECKVAIANHYYLVRLQNSKKPEEQAAAAKIKAVLPDQDGRGVHANISGAAMLKSAPNKAEAQKFLEFLVSDTAQAYFANGNYEFPVVASVARPQVLTNLGEFKTDTINVRVYGENQAEAQKLFDKAGWR
ncbi:MAG TPA: Fe(3+) ABC transporter substrate-binding protein [Alphaproteobacteria bacterium]|nr:Fe(3+) ABC transporter substrate-binding protein [Alphaproteobacteria bacterium]